MTYDRRNQCSHLVDVMHSAIWLGYYQSKQKRALGKSYDQKAQLTDD